MRLAVAARPSEIAALVVRHGLRPMWVGAGLGVAVSVALGPLLSRWLFGVAPLGGLTIGGALAAASVVALVATYTCAESGAGRSGGGVFGRREKGELGLAVVRG